MTDDLGFIHRFLPGRGQARGETLLVLHGTGGDENDLVGIGQSIAPGAAILSPRGNVLENGAPRFFKRLAEGVFDPKEVRSRAEELARFIRAAAITGIDWTHPHLRARLLERSQRRFDGDVRRARDLLRGAILLRPMLVYEPDGTERSERLQRCCISAGRMDPIVPAEQRRAPGRSCSSQPRGSDAQVAAGRPQPGAQRSARSGGLARSATRSRMS